MYFVLSHPIVLSIHDLVLNRDKFLLENNHILAFSKLILIGITTWARIGSLGSMKICGKRWGLHHWGMGKGRGKGGGSGGSEPWGVRTCRRNKVASDDDGNLGRGVDLGPFILYWAIQSCLEYSSCVWVLVWGVACGVWGVAPSYRVREAVDESWSLSETPIKANTSLILSSYSTASIFHFCFFSFTPISVSHVTLIDHMDTDVYSRLTTRHDWWEKTLEFSSII